MLDNDKCYGENKSENLCRCVILNRIFREAFTEVVLFLFKNNLLFRPLYLLYSLPRTPSSNPALIFK